jgi:predicted PurR-regulated permease PerM
VVAAVWPIKRWLDRFVPSWLSYGGTISALLGIAVAFVGGLWFASSHVVKALAANQGRFDQVYNTLAVWGRQLGVDEMDSSRIYAELVGPAQALATSVYTIMVYLGFVLLLVILLLPEVPLVGRKLAESIDRQDNHEVLAAIEQIAVKVRRYLGTTLVTSALTGFASTAWSLTVGLELALVWGVLNFLLNFIPIVGNIVGILPPTLYAVVQFQSVSMAALVLAGFLVLQIAISNFVYPALQGHSLALSPFAIVLALAFWGWMWGLAGVLLAIPLTVACVIAADHYPSTRWLARLLAR